MTKLLDYGSHLCMDLAPLAAACNCGAVFACSRVQVCVGATCPEERLHLLLPLLDPAGGRLLAPVENDLRLYTRSPDGKIRHRVVSSVRFSDLEVRRTPVFGEGGRWCAVSACLCSHVAGPCVAYTCEPRVVQCACVAYRPDVCPATPGLIGSAMVAAWAAGWLGGWVGGWVPLQSRLVHSVRAIAKYCCGWLPCAASRYHLMPTSSCLCWRTSGQQPWMLLCHHHLSVRTWPKALTRVRASVCTISVIWAVVCIHHVAC
jgi:hypothetical protein